MHEFNAGGGARMSSSKIWDKKINELTNGQSQIWRRASALPKNWYEISSKP